MEGETLWLARCDACGRLRLRAVYFEVYDPWKCWWQECVSCLLDTVTEYVEARARESEDRTLALDTAPVGIGYRDLDEHDLEKDEGDGGLGSGGWLDE